MLDFDFQHDGTWEAWGDSGLYTIEVCDDGEFVASFGDDETDHDLRAAKTFLTYREARDWCNTTENTLKQAAVVTVYTVIISGIPLVKSRLEFFLCLFCALLYTRGYDGTYNA